jgi:hypothetical protein
MSFQTPGSTMNLRMFSASRCRKLAELSQELIAGDARARVRQRSLCSSPDLVEYRWLFDEMVLEIASQLGDDVLTRLEREAANLLDELFGVGCEPA